MNDSKPLPPIPTPISVVWREFRIQVIPLVIFAVVLCGAVYVWKTIPMSGNLRGVGEGLRSVVTSPRVGVLQRLEVKPFQWVEAGDPLVTILPFDPNAQLDLLQSELQLTRLRLEPSMADRNALDYVQVRVDLMALKNQLAITQAELRRATNTLSRHETLVKDNLLTKDIYEQTVRDRDIYEAGVKELTASIQEIEGRLNDLRSLGVPQSETNQVSIPLLGTLEARLKAVETNWSPVTLVAPISGRVHMIARQSGEFLVEGEPLVTIASPRAERIVAYMRQPFSVDPQPGMEVEVSIESKQHQKFLSRISEVGAQMEAITNQLAFIQQGALVDMGLPIIVAVPPNVQLRPGETVSLTLRSSQPKSPGTADTTDSSKPMVQARR